MVSDFLFGYQGGQENRDGITHFSVSNLDSISVKPVPTTKGAVARLATSMREVYAQVEQQHFKTGCTRDRVVATLHGRFQCPVCNIELPRIGLSGSPVCYRIDCSGSTCNRKVLN
jgi:hypothetical protein